LSPPFVVPAGSRLEATGASTPSWNSPAASGHTFPRHFFPILFHREIREKKDLADPAKSFGFAWWPRPDLRNN